MTDRQKRIYNVYQHASSEAYGHPLRSRTDFSGFEESNPEDFAAIEKLERVFDQLPRVNMHDFFSAPYKIYGGGDGRRYPLSWYLKYTAMKAYKTAFFSDFEHNTLDDASTRDRVSGYFDAMAAKVSGGVPLRGILVSDDPVMPPKWLELYSRHVVDDWFLVAFRLIGKDLVGMMPKMFRDGVVSEDHLDFIERAVGEIERNPGSGDARLFLAVQVGKLVEAEKARKKSQDSKKQG